MSSTETTPAFKTDAIGTPADPVEFAVERERMVAYAAATNDTTAQHASGELASPVFSIVPSFQAMGMASLSVIPPELLGAILHGEQDFHYHRPIEAGMTLTGLILDEDRTISLPCRQDIPIGHKVALRDMTVGETVVKYGVDIGKVVQPIAKGEHAHVHNIKTKRW